jgi:hypothetical protein
MQNAVGSRVRGKVEGKKGKERKGARMGRAREKLLNALCDTSVLQPYIHEF